MSITAPPTLHLTRFAARRGLTQPGSHVLSRLLLDESLFRDTSSGGSHLVVPTPEPEPSADSNVIVLGLSGSIPDLVHSDLARRDGVPMIRRFSGGGTVVVNDDSLLVTFVTSEPVCKPYPREIMEWMGSVFSAALSQQQQHGDYRVSTRENDLVWGDFKIGGHAQAISGSRWMHHTSLLWRVHPGQMQYLKMPNKQPAYRAGRDHVSFTRGLAEMHQSKQACIDAIVASMVAQLGAAHSLVEAKQWPVPLERTRNVLMNG